MNNNTLNDDLEWAAVSDLSAGEFFTLGTTCPLTFVSHGTYLTRWNTAETAATVLAGIRDGKPYAKTFYRPALEVLIVPDEHVGERVGTAVEAFRGRNFTGSERVELPDGIWPWSAADDAEVAA